MHHGAFGSLIWLAVLVAILIYAGRGVTVVHHEAAAEDSDDAE